MPSPKKMVIIAGEESGDMHGANLVKQLLDWDNTLVISGIGGQHMQEAGVNLVSDLARYGVTGFTEVLRHVLVIKKAFKLIKAHLQEVKPDVLLLIDYPGFNLRLAKFAKKHLGLHIIYYISPQVWAWKAKRIHTIRACIDKMAVILPFEKAIYQQAGVPVAFVGHPLVDKIPHFDNLQALRSSLGLPIQSRLIALLPGSRDNEIEQHLPVMAKTAQLLNSRHPNLHFVIPIARTINPETVKAYFNKSRIEISFIHGNAIDVAACSDCIIVASGTASLECALLTKPMCIIYKASMLTYIAATKLIKVKYLGLCNLLKNEMIVPEFLQYDCNAKELAIMVDSLLMDKSLIENMVAKLQTMKNELSSEQADLSIADLVKNELNRPSPRVAKFTKLCTMEKA